MATCTQEGGGARSLGQALGHALGHALCEALCEALCHALGQALGQAPAQAPSRARGSLGMALAAPIPSASSEDGVACWIEDAAIE